MIPVTLRNIYIQVENYNLSGLSARIEFFKYQSFSFAIDDFGIDSFNEEIIILLQPDFIKLDKWHMVTLHLFEAIMLTKKEGASVIIEGVETREQLEILTCVN